MMRITKLNIFEILLVLCIGTLCVCIYTLHIKLSINLKVSTKNRDSLFTKEVTYPVTLTGDFILNNVSLCPHERQVTALVLVHSAAQHFSRRQNIRSTYGSCRLFLPAEVRVVFLLGIVQNFEIQEKIQEEHTKYGDTIQGNFVDTYHNLTNKGIMGFRWILNYCQNVKYVVKVDDDVIFDMWWFLGNETLFNSTKSLFCTSIEEGEIYREGKWSVPMDQYVGLSQWPWTYCQGFVVIMTGDVISDLLRAAHMTPFLWIDDVYLYGYLPSQIKNVSIINMPKTLKLVPEAHGGVCLSFKRSKCPVLAVGTDEKTYSFYWKFILLRNNKSVTSNFYL